MTRVFSAGSVLCDECTQERSGGAGHGGAALPPGPAGGRAAAGSGVPGRLAGRAAPPLREGGMPVRAGRAARAVCVPVGRGPHGLRAGGAGGRGPRSPGDIQAAAGGAGGGLGGQPGTAGPPGTGLAHASGLRRAAAGAPGPGGARRDGRLAGQHGRGRARGRAGGHGGGERR